MKQTKNRYKNNGPLVFKPFNENSAFKPITPVPKSPTKTKDTEMMNGEHQSDSNTNDGNEHVYNITSSTAAPRILSTSLKRHISNVETYNRARPNDETNSMSDDEDSVTPPSSSSASTARGKRLHYADLAPLSTSTSNTNLNLINGTTSSSRNNNINNNNNGSASSSSSCTISSYDNKNAADANPSEYNNLPASQTNTNGSLPIKRTTQYATLKFNEVNI